MVKMKGNFVTSVVTYTSNQGMQIKKKKYKVKKLKSRKSHGD